MPDTDRLINKAQGDDIITALNGITSRLQEMYTVDDALSSTSEHPVQNKVVKEALDNKADESDLADKADKSDIASTQTATGNPLTLTDCAPINAESLVVELLPKQDLHGHDFPWVGGAGKNKLPMTVDGIKAANTDGTWTGNAYAINGVTFTINTDTDGNVTSLKVNGTASATIFFKLCDFPVCLTDGTSYKINGNASGYGSSTAYMQVQTSNGGGVANVGSEYTLAYTSGGTAQRLIIRIGTSGNPSNLVFYPMIRLSTETDPTFAPYSNICPITGYTECEVDDVGKNLFDKTKTVDNKLMGLDGVIANNTRCYSDYIPIKGNTDYYLTNVLGSGSFNTSIHFDENMQVIGDKNIGGSGTQSGKITSFPNSAYMVVNANMSEKDTIQVEEGSTPTSYEPYASTSATIQFGQTVYGGSVDFNTGVVTITDANIASYAGETLPSTWISDRDAYSSGGTPTTGAQVVYKLATQTTLQLTPQELKLLQNTNNITTNGTTINLGYQPDNVIGDVKGEIEKCAVDAEFMQFTDGTDTFTDVNLSLDALSHTVSVVGSKIEQKRFICFEVMDKMGGVLQGILASCIAFTDGAKTPSGTAFRAYIDPVSMYVDLRICGSGGSYMLSYQSETSFSASAFFVRVRMMNNL